MKTPSSGSSAHGCGSGFQAVLLQRSRESQGITGSGRLAFVLTPAMRQEGTSEKELRLDESTHAESGSSRGQTPLLGR
jgi:hypothetical protein